VPAVGEENFQDAWDKMFASKKKGGLGVYEFFALIERSFKVGLAFHGGEIIKVKIIVHALMIWCFPSHLSRLGGGFASCLPLVGVNFQAKAFVLRMRRVILFFSSSGFSYRAKGIAIKESKDLTSLSLDELIVKLKVHEMIIKKDSEIVKEKVERKSLALKAKKESSDEECSTFGSKDEEYTMAVRDFKKFFKRRDKNQRAFVGGSWSYSGEKDDEKVNNETCLVAQASSEICLGVNLEPDK
ncbi:hypothetical protein Tco_0861215, partial [Tanacetum coccineum]